MISVCIMQIITGITVLQLAFPGVFLYENFQLLIPNGNRVPDPCVNYQVWNGVGHTSIFGGGARNPFGIDFFNEGMEWTSALCEKDSDNDGWTNGEELGDPDCTWRPGLNNPELPFGDVGKHPGVCEPYDSPSCQRLNTANGITLCQEKRTFYCPATEQSGVQSVRLRLPQGTEVPISKTTYMCKYYDLPSDKDYHVIGVKPIIGNSKVLHHMVVYGCPDTAAEFVSGFSEPKMCSLMVSVSCPVFLNIWVLGSPGSCMVDEAGLRFGKTTFNKVIIEYHWTNGPQETGLTDTSGVQIFFQDASLRQYDAATTAGGPAYLAIPPQMESVVWQGSLPEGTCSKEFYPQTIYILDMYLHMHLIGRSAKAERWRNGNKVQTIAKATNYDFNNPEVIEFRPPIMFLPGDEMRMVCEFDSSSRSAYTYYGEATTDEMCFATYTYYPNQRTTNWITMGGLDPCSLTGSSRQPAKTTCDATKFYFSMENVVNDAISAGCDPNGKTCPETCATYLREVGTREPCMKGDWKYLAQSVILKVEAQVKGVPSADLTESTAFAMRACDRLVLDVGKWKTNNGAGNVSRSGRESTTTKKIVDVKTGLMLGMLCAWITLKYLIITLK